MRYCIKCGVSQRDRFDLGFYQFPSQEERFKRWVEILELDKRIVAFGQKPSKFAICSLHFKPSQFFDPVKKLNLKRGALPFGLKRIRKPSNVIRNENSNESENTENTMSKTKESKGNEDKVIIILNVNQNEYQNKISKTKESNGNENKILIAVKNLESCANCKAFLPDDEESRRNQLKFTDQIHGYSSTHSVSQFYQSIFKDFIKPTTSSTTLINEEFFSNLRLCFKCSDIFTKLHNLFWEFLIIGYQNESLLSTLMNFRENNNCTDNDNDNGNGGDCGLTRSTTEVTIKPKEEPYDGEIILKSEEFIESSIEDFEEFTNINDFDYEYDPTADASGPGSINSTQIEVNDGQESQNIDVNESNSNYECQICHKICISSIYLQNHMKNHLKKFQCMSCKKKFRYPYELRKHELSDGCLSYCNNTSIKDINSDLDQSMTTSKARVGKGTSNKRESTITLSSEPKSKKQFHYSDSEIYDNNNDASPCQENDFDTDYSDKESKNEESHLCHICSQIFTDSFKLDQHLKSHSKETFMCPLPDCIKTFKSNDDLQDHINVHNNVKVHKCPEDQCDMTFYTRKQLANHLLDHKKFKGSFQCTLCQSSFDFEKILISHTNAVHNYNYNGNPAEKIIYVKFVSNFVNQTSLNNNNNNKV